MSNNFAKKINRLKRREAEKEINKEIKKITQNGKIALGEGYLLYLKKIHTFFAKRWDELNEDHQEAITKMLRHVPDIAHHLNDIFWENRDEKGELSDSRWCVNTKQAELLVMLAIPREEEEVVMMDQEAIKTKIFGLDGRVLN